MSTKRSVPFEVVEPDEPGAPPPVLAPEPARTGLSLKEHIDVVVERRREVAVTLALVLAAGAAYAALAPPLYRSDALLLVEDRKGGKGFLGDLDAMFGQSSPSEAEIEILRSRTLLGAVVTELNLDVEARPRRFPLVGSAMARLHGEEDVAGAPFGLSSFGWGGERIQVDRLEVPPRLLGETLRLTAGEAGRYALHDPDGRLLLEGEVGKAAAVEGVEIFVPVLRARPGLTFSVSRKDRDETVVNLQEDLRITEKGKKTGILRLVLEGPDKRRNVAVLEALSHAYVRQNVERRSAEAGKTLEFLESQLPLLRGNLVAAETELERYRSRNGSVDVTLETQAALTRVVEIEKAVSEARVEYAALRHKFTDDHPAIAALSGRIERLESERNVLDARLRTLPQAELESARRLRDVKVANELYVTLLNKAQELKVVKEGTIGNVRIIDPAVVPLNPVAPRKLAVLGMALLVGLTMGVGVAFVRRALEEGVHDPEALERALGVGVHASVPHSDAQHEAERRARRTGGPVTLLAASNPRDLAVESLRSLRTSLQFALLEARKAIVSISGPAPGVGKSFVSANLAHLLGEAGKRVLVLDADLRRGRLHQQYDAERGHGLSDVIVGESQVESVLRQTSSPNVTLLTTGTIPPNPAELLGSERFHRVLADLAARYDVVLVDTPPVLAVTDAALIARHTGVNLLVVRAGKHPMRELSAALRVFARSGVRVHGMVMNDVRLDGVGRGGRFHYQYRYE